jgi:hypothetical protein
MGTQITGDVGPLSIYTTRGGRRVAYPHAPPTTPPTYAQSWQRTRLTMAALAWTQLPAADKTNWNLATQRTGIRLAGMQLFVACALAGDRGCYATIARQAGVTLEPLPEYIRK